VKSIGQRSLFDRSGDILRQAENGERFTITVDGRPVAELGPVSKHRWVRRQELTALLRTNPPDPKLFEDIEAAGPWIAEPRDPSKE
jgi:prevent-host-death family protein